MNNPKLTNVLLIALLVLNCFLIVCLAGRRHNQHNRMQMYGMFGRHRHGGEWAFRHHHFYGNFKNFHHMGGEREYENGHMENRQGPKGI